MEKTKCIICETTTDDKDCIYMFSSKPVCVNCANKLGKITKLPGNNSLKGYLSSLEDNKKEKENKSSLMHPMEIKAGLDEYVVGQDSAKKILSVAAYNHYKRMHMNDSEIKKSNVLLIGTTGCGKTYLVQTLAKILNVPLANVPATNLTEVGYVGNDVETIIQRLFVMSGCDVEKTEKGIVFIDEIDKLVPSKNAIREVGGKGVQQALLPIIEGTKVEVNIPDGKNVSYGASQPKVTIDTSNILFICGGAFPDVEDIIKDRLNAKSKSTGIGFNSSTQNSELEFDEEDIFQYIKVEDLKEFGMIPEFIGRLPVIANLKPLDIASLKQILFAPKGSLVSQYKKLFGFDNKELEFSDDALEEIAKKAFELGTGARSLRTIMEDLLLELMYTIPSDVSIHSVLITPDFVLGTGSPLFNASEPLGIEDKTGGDFIFQLPDKEQII